MHVLLDTRIATPHYPGIARYAGELAAALVELLPELGGRLTLLVPPVCTFHIPDGEHCRTVISSKTPSEPRQQKVVEALVAQIRPDLYHSPYYLMPILPELPTVLTVHDCIPLMQPAENSVQSRIQYRTAVARALRACTRAIAVSENTRADCKRFFAEDYAKIKTIPHGVDGRYAPQSEEACAAVAERHGLERPLILYVGSNRPHKNIAALLHAYAQARPLLKGHRLVIAGYGSEKTKLDSSIMKSAGIERDVSWIGPVPEADLAALFSCASVFVFPSLYEGFGLPVLEAMATGTPVACSDTPGLRELGAKAATYFNPADPASIAQALVACVGNESRRKQQIAAGLTRAASFRWETVARSTWRVYENTLAEFDERAAKS